MTHIGTRPNLSYRVMRLHRKPIFISCILLYLLSQIFFLINIQFPTGHNFDEFHYVPAAKSFMKFEGNRNPEHPPFAKYLIAIGIASDEDRPFGWRVMSTIFGALTLVGMYLWAVLLFRSNKIAWMVAAVTLFNHLLYVQARIAMLDTFMMAFIVWGCVAFYAAWNPDLSRNRTRNYLLIAGICFGLATACKWFAVVPWGMCILMVLLLRLFQSWELTLPGTSNWKMKFKEFQDWYSKWLLSAIPNWYLGLSLIIVPLFIYFLTFVPLLALEDQPYGITDLFSLQYEMVESQSRVGQTHPYKSHWTEWPLLTRPMWYAFDKEGVDLEWVRGVFLLGNPLIMWFGLVAIGFCIWAWLAKRSKQAFFILAFFFGFYLSWMVIPRKITFYYYYYPAAMMLSLAIGLVFRYVEQMAPKWEKASWGFVLASFLIFVYFFPILAALRIEVDSFNQWMWLSSWI